MQADVIDFDPVSRLQQDPKLFRRICHSNHPACEELRDLIIEAVIARRRGLPFYRPPQECDALTRAAIEAVQFRRDDRGRFAAARSTRMPTEGNA